MRSRLPVCVSLVGVAFAFLPAAARGADLVRGVRYKLSAGDLSSAEAAVEDYRRDKGVDPEYLDAVGWLARGALMLGRQDLAASFVAKLRREIPEERPELVIPLGAAIEVEGRLQAAREGRGSALHFLEGEAVRARDVALRARIWKNINLLSLEGQPAPEIAPGDHAGPAVPRLADLKGRPILLFLWAHWCSDCRAQAPTVGRLFRRYGPRGLVLLAPTRLYGEGSDGSPLSPSREKEAIARVWSEYGPDLQGVPVPVDTDTMVRYGVSATPTLVLVDRGGIVRLYAPTRLTEAELSRRIEEVLVETP